MNKTIIIRIIAVTGLLFPLLWIIQYFSFRNWQDNPTPENEKSLSRVLNFSLAFTSIQILIICFFFYQYGRTFIHVMGTFY